MGDVELDPSANIADGSTWVRHTNGGRSFYRRPRDDSSITLDHPPAAASVREKEETNYENGDAEWFEDRWVQLIEKNDTEVVKAAIANDPEALKFASPECQNDRDIVGAAVTQNGLVLEFASEELKNDTEVVKAAIANDPEALEFASADMQNDRDIVGEAVSKKLSVLNWAKTDLLRDSGMLDMIYNAVRLQGVDSVSELSSSLRADPRVIKAAMKHDHDALRWASTTHSPLRSDPEFVLDALSQPGAATDYLPKCVKSKEFRNRLKIKRVQNGLQLITDSEGRKVWTLPHAQPKAAIESICPQSAQQPQKSVKNNSTGTTTEFLASKKHKTQQGHSMDKGGASSKATKPWPHPVKHKASTDHMAEGPQAKKQKVNAQKTHVSPPTSGTHAAPGVPTSQPELLTTTLPATLGVPSLGNGPDAAVPLPPVAAATSAAAAAPPAAAAAAAAAAGGIGGGVAAGDERRHGCVQEEEITGVSRLKVAKAKPPLSCQDELQRDELRAVVRLAHSACVIRIFLNVRVHVVGCWIATGARYRRYGG